MIILVAYGWSFQVLRLQNCLDRAESAKQSSDQRCNHLETELLQLKKEMHCMTGDADQLREALAEGELELLNSKASLVAARSEAARLRADLPRLVSCLSSAEESNVRRHARKRQA